MRQLVLFGIIIFIALCADPIFATSKPTENQLIQDAHRLLHRMSLKEKIGQKLMFDFRYWCSTAPMDNQPCTEDFIRINSAVKNIINQNHIGGIILFSNNIKKIAQVTTLTNALQRTMTETKNLPLLIASDQEGGIVTRLPRDANVTFPGNMAIAAAYLGRPDEPYSSKIAKMIATDLKAVGINTNFAPDVDVNVNSQNPVIHVRSFSDDPELVAQLGLAFSQALQSEGVASTLKHFPGHGDTITDSHISLPVVNHNLEDAWNIDLYPFKKIIEQNPPDLIMTAHIQFPALDSGKINASKIDEYIVAPATLSRNIQHELLRNQLGYRGVIVTDALDMGAIAHNFDSIDATIKAFQAGNDIALMPLMVYQPEDAVKVTELISTIEAAVLNKTLSETELNESVLRIILLKMKLDLFQPDETPLEQKISRAQQHFADKSRRELENSITNDAITLVQNKNNLIPITLVPDMRIHIITPWLEQGAGMAVELKKLQEDNKIPPNLQISFVKLGDTNLEAEQLAIDNADIVIVGNNTAKSLPLINNGRLNFNRLDSQIQGTLVFPDIPMGDRSKSRIESSPLLTLYNDFNEAKFAYQLLHYAKNQGKKTIFISLLAPYDLPNYRNVSAAMLAGYNPYGYLNDGHQGYYRGPSIPALTRIIFGLSNASARLPINIPNPTNSEEIVYPRGYGISTYFY